MSDVFKVLSAWALFGLAIIGAILTSTLPFLLLIAIIGVLT